MFDDDYATLVADSAPAAAGTARWQGSLFDDEDPWVEPIRPTARRRALDDSSWIDLVPCWLHGADTVLAALHDQVRWRCPVVTMYERRLPQPRLSAWYRIGDPDTGDGAPQDPRTLAPVLEEVRTVLSAAYEVAFDSIGLNLYRDGRDSVAWHGDRHARSQQDPVVAIVTLGTSRPFLLRPTDGGASVRLTLHAGDLLVMGGSCQHRWEHSVPKVRTAGPRLSITFRHSG